jgi:anion-transporting  ArsA/GET3 family ATPase
LGERSYVSVASGKDIPPHKEIMLKPNLYVSLWTGEGCLQEYIQHLVKVERLARLFFENKIMKTFLRAAPALKEISILGKLTSALRNVGPKFEYDRIVLDAYSTGHFLALIKSPLGLSELIEQGPMGEQTRDINTILCDPQLVRPIIVSLPEELPARESVELHREIKSLLGTNAPIICNRFLTQEQNIKNFGESDFGLFIKGKVSQQQGALKLLAAEKLNVHTAPFVFSSEYFEIVERLSFEIEGFDGI